MSIYIRTLSRIRNGITHTHIIEHEHKHHHIGDFEKHEHRMIEEFEQSQEHLQDHWS